MNYGITIGGDILGSLARNIFELLCKPDDEAALAGGYDGMNAISKGER